FLNFDLILGLIAVFVFTTASREYRYVRDSQMLTSVPVHHVMRRRYTLLAPSDPVGLALRLMTRNGEQGFLLLDELGRPSMAVDEETLLAHVMEGKPEQTPVGELARRVPAPLAATMPLSDAIRQMEQHQLELMPVMEAGTMVGVLDLQRARKLGRLYART
ncbi:MAG: CBS domain-containing protein, partial [Bacteroidetes bacterium]